MSDIADEHYAFPILDTSYSFGLSRDNYRILSYFNKIIVQSDIEKDVLITNCDFIDPDKVIKFVPKIDMVEYKKICDKNTYHFANYASNKKFYFIGNLDRDEKTIQKIVFALYSNASYKLIPPICVFFLDFDSKPDIQSLDNNIKKIRNDFGIPDNEGKEIFIFKHFSEEELITAHNSCDIYLSVNENQVYYLHEEYARLCGNTIISLDNIFDSLIPHRTEELNFAYQIQKRYVSVAKLTSVFKEHTI
jgi:hypothetical protein